MKAILAMIFIGTVMATGSIVMGSVLGSVEFRGGEWHIRTLASAAALGGILIGSAISFTLKGSKQEADDE